MQGPRLREFFPVRVIGTAIQSALILSASLGFGQAADAVTDWSNAANPNNPWSYGSTPTLGGNFALYTTPATNDGQTGIDSWATPTNCVVPRLPVVTHNRTGAPVSYATIIQPADLLNLHPGCSGEYSIVRWTAPATGTYQFQGKFQGIDTIGTTTDVHIRLNSSTSLFDSGINGYGATAAFSFSQSVNAGDTVDFAVGDNSTFGYDSTGFDVAITTQTTQTTTFNLRQAFNQLNLAPGPGNSPAFYSDPTVLAPVGLTIVPNAVGLPGAGSTGILQVYASSADANAVHPTGTTTEIYIFGPGTTQIYQLNCTTFAWTGPGTLNAFTLTRPGKINGASNPNWALYAYDAGGVLLSSTGEGDITNGGFSEPPNYADFTVSSATPIAQVVFCAHNVGGTSDALPLSGGTYDPTLPVITPTVTGTSGNNGWYVSGVNVTWSVSDPESGITSSAGCSPSSLTGETAGTTLTCSATNGVGFSNSASVTIKIDKTNPTITASATKADSTAYTAGTWTNQTVTVHYNCGDLGGSGLTTCPADQVFSVSGATASVSGTATDNAGNSASAIFGAVQIDKTIPTITAAAATSPNLAGWYNSDVVIHFTCSDGTGSGIPVCPADQTLSTEGAAVSSTAQTVADAVGNTSAPSNVVTVKIDKTNPTISASATTSPNAAGWYKGNVIIHFTCSDGTGSGIPACPADQTLSAEGTAVASTATTVTDAAGNTSAPSNMVTVKIDKTIPTITASATKADSTAYTAGTWTNQTVTVHFACGDALSGLATPCPTDRVFSADGQTASVSGSTADNAGNGANTSFGPVQVDKTKPTLNPFVNPNPVLLNGIATATAGAVDAISGIASQSCGALVTNSTGTKTVSCTATDKAGNTNSVSTNYAVVSNLTGSTTVQPGQSYNFTGGTLTGLSMTGGSVTLNGTTVSGNITVNGGTINIGPGVTISGNLTFQNILAGAGSSQVCGAIVIGNLTFQNNASPVLFGATGCVGNKVGGNVTILSNTAPVQVVNNIISKNLSCTSNTTITGSGNIANKKQGQCAAF